MSSPEFSDGAPAIPNQAQAWLELFETSIKFNGDAAIESDPTARAALEESAGLAQLRMEFYEEDPQTAAELQQLIDYDPPLRNADDLKSAAPRRHHLEALLGDTSQHDSVITPAKIQAKLDALPVPDFAPSYPREALDIARYALAYSFGNLPQKPTEVADQRPASPAPPAADKPAAAPTPPAPAAAPNPNGAERRERIREPLTVKVYSQDYVLEFPDGSLVPLRRQTGNIGSTAQIEDGIASSRLTVLQYINGLSERTLTTEIWAKCFPETEYSSGQWDIRLASFLAETTYQDLPLAELYKVTPAARRRYYEPGAYDINFEQVEAESSFESPNYFALPDGTLLAPREAKMMKLLLSVGTSPESAVTREMFDNSGLISSDELAVMKAPDTAFSNTISMLREKLRDTGFDSLYIIHKLDHPTARTGSNRPEVMYWLEAKGELSNEELQTNAAVVSVTELILANLAIFTEASGVNINIDKLKSVAEAYKNKSAPKATDESSPIEQLRHLVDIHVYEELMNRLSDNDNAFELLEILTVFIDDDKDVSTQRFDALIAALEAGQHPESGSTAPSPSPNNTPKDADPRGTMIREINERLQADCGDYIDQILARMDDRGILNPSINPTPFTVNQEFGTRYKPKGNDRAPSVEEIIFDLVTASPEFADVVATKQHRTRSLNEILKDFIAKKISTYEAQRISRR